MQADQERQVFKFTCGNFSTMGFQLFMKHAIKMCLVFFDAKYSSVPFKAMSLVFPVPPSKHRRTSFPEMAIFRNGLQSEVNNGGVLNTFYILHTKKTRFEHVLFFAHQKTRL